MKKIISFILSAFILCFGYQVSLMAEETEQTETAQNEVFEQENEQITNQPVQQESVTRDSMELPAQNSSEDPTSDPEMIIDEDVIIQTNETKHGWYDNHTRYYVDGTALDGMQLIGYDYCYFKNTILDTSFTGFVKDNMNNKWYFVRNGVSDWGFTGVAKSIFDNKWYHAKSGELDWRFTGISKSVENGKWYFSKNGKLDWGFTGVAKSIFDNKWYHAKSGELDWKFTGISKSVENGKWYFSRNGKLDWGFTGVAKSIFDNQWYHVRKGELDWKFTGVSKSVENGKWYHSKNGKLDWGFTGVSRSVENNKLYYSKRGQLDWSYTGLAKDMNNKYHYVYKGAVLSSGKTQIDSAISWALTTALNDKHGYSQNNRMSGIDFDCSSFIYFALLNGGYQTSALGSYAFTTYNIASVLTANGFKLYSYNAVKNSLKPGDILVSSGHTELYVGNGKTVGAHYGDAYGQYGDQNGKEVSVENLSEFFLTYTQVLRAN